jgi:hypothetical protein
MLVTIREKREAWLEDRPCGSNGDDIANNGLLCSILRYLTKSGCYYGG